MTAQGHGRPRTATAIRFDPAVHEALAQAAAERDLSINFLVNLAVREMLPRDVPVCWARAMGAHESGHAFSGRPLPDWCDDCILGLGT